MHCLARAPHLGTYVDFLSDKLRKKKKEGARARGEARERRRETRDEKREREKSERESEERRERDVRGERERRDERWERERDEESEESSEREEGRRDEEREKRREREKGLRGLAKSSVEPPQRLMTHSRTPQSPALGTRPIPARSPAEREGCTKMGRGVHRDGWRSTNMAEERMDGVYWLDGHRKSRKSTIITNATKQLYPQKKQTSWCLEEQWINVLKETEHRYTVTCSYR